MTSHTRPTVRRSRCPYLHALASKDLVEAVRGAGDIVRLVSEYVPLKPSGGRMKGLCPFHQEKTPSFSVDPKNQLFYCFGCHTGGDLFKFVMLYEKVDFRQAVETLATRFGVRLPSISSAGEAPLQRLLQMNEAASTFYKARLGDGGQRAREYLHGRGIHPETAVRLGLGYAPQAWESLRSHLLTKGFKPEEMVTGGLSLPRKEGRGEYDRFRDRLMFPIRDANGRTVAFGGRSLDGSEPKYLNSPETPAYVKGSHLYGLDLAREAIRREGCAVVVEGYLDLAAVVQAGFHHAVASLGTAFTPEQARLLARFTDVVVVSYDGDSAGVTAAVRTLDLLLEKGFRVRVAELPSGVDPDDLIRKGGPEAYAERLREAPGYLEFLLHREARERDLSRIEEKVAAINHLLPRLSRFPSAIERAAWAGRIADQLQIEDELVLQELRAALRGARGRIRQRAPLQEPLRQAEALLVSRLLRPEAGTDLASLGLEPADLEGTRVAGIVETILRFHREGKPADYARVFDALEGEEDKQLLTRIAFQDDREGQDGNLTDCMQVLRRDRLLRERRRLQREIELSTNPAGIDALLLRKQQLGRQIDSLS